MLCSAKDSAGSTSVQQGIEAGGAEARAAVAALLSDETTSCTPYPGSNLTAARNVRLWEHGGLLQRARRQGYFRIGAHAFQIGCIHGGFDVQT